MSNKRATLAAGILAAFALGSTGAMATSAMAEPSISPSTSVNSSSAGENPKGSKDKIVSSFKLPQVDEITGDKGLFTKLVADDSIKQETFDFSKSKVYVEKKENEKSSDKTGDKPVSSASSKIASENKWIIDDARTNGKKELKDKKIDPVLSSSKVAYNIAIADAGGTKSSKLVFSINGDTNKKITLTSEEAAKQYFESLKKAQESEKKSDNGTNHKVDNKNIVLPDNYEGKDGDKLSLIGIEVNSNDEGNDTAKTKDEKKSEVIPTSANKFLKQAFVVQLSDGNITTMSDLEKANTVWNNTNKNDNKNEEKPKTNDVG